MHGFRKLRLPNNIEDELQRRNFDEVEFCGNDALLEYRQEINIFGVYEKASAKLLDSKEKMKEKYDKRINPRSTFTFIVGDNVLIPNRKRNKGKLQNLWDGPIL